MRTEIENLLPSFRVEITQATLRHRGEGDGAVNAFVREVRDHRDRYEVKLNGLRQRGAPADSLNAVSKQLDEYANQAIARATASGQVELAA